MSHHHFSGRDLYQQPPGYLRRHAQDDLNFVPVQGTNVKIGINATVLGARDTGVEVWIRGLIRALATADSSGEAFEYVIFVPEGVELWSDGFLPEKMHVFPVGGIGASCIARILWEEIRLPALCRRLDLDALHCPAYVSPRWVTVPTVVTLHDLFVYTHPECCRWRNRLHFRLRMPPTVRGARRIHCTSHWTRECLGRQFPGTETRARVVHPGVDDLFQPGSDRAIEQYRKKHDLPENPFLFVGNPEPKKNLGILLRAFRRLLDREDRTETLVLVGGDGWGMRRVERTISDLGLENGVVRMGYVARDELPLLYGMSRALVFPSTIEGFGLPPLEAMACGTPVITTGEGGLSESVGEAALRVGKSDIHGLAEAMARLSESAEEREKLVQAGLERAERFRWSELIDGMVRIYQEAVSG